MTWCVMRITSFSIDKGSWRDRAYYIGPGSSATAALVKVGKNSDATKIKRVCNIEKVLNMENIDSYLGINDWFLSWNQCLNFPSYYPFGDCDLFYCWFTVISFNSISDSKYKVSIDA